MLKDSCVLLYVARFKQVFLLSDRSWLFLFFLGRRAGKITNGFIVIEILGVFPPFDLWNKGRFLLMYLGPIGIFEPRMSFDVVSIIRVDMFALIILA